jgi:hypothetical protein
LVATNFHVVAQAAKARVVFEFKDGNTAGVKQIDRVDLGTISPTRGSFSADSRHAVWPGTGGFLGLYEFLLRRSASIKLLAAASRRPYDESDRGGARRWE